MNHEPYSMSAKESEELQRAVHPNCPECGREFILATPVHIDATGARQSLTCKKCWNRWNVDYTVRFTKG